MSSILQISWTISMIFIKNPSIFHVWNDENSRRLLQNSSTSGFYIALLLKTLVHVQNTLNVVLDSSLRLLFWCHIQNGFYYCVFHFFVYFSLAMINQSFIWHLGSLTNHNASIEIFKQMYPIRSNFQDKFRASKHIMIGKCISVFSALNFLNNNFVWSIECYEAALNNDVTKEGAQHIELVKSKITTASKRSVAQLKMSSGRAHFTAESY